MNYLDKARDHASMVAYSTKGDEYTFDETGLAYFLDSIGFPQQKKEWVWLTKEEKKDIFDLCEPKDRGSVAAMVEAKLKEKNGY